MIGGGRPGAVPRSLVIGLGAQKSGTTWLTSQMKRSPDFVINRKEYNYWSAVRRPYRQTSRWVARQNRDRFRFIRKKSALDPSDHSVYRRRLYRGVGRHQLAVDFSPDYALCSDLTFREIAGFHDDVRSVIVLRDPVQRMWSGLCHEQRVTRSNVPGSDLDMDTLFSEAIADRHSDPQLRSRYDELLNKVEAARMNYLVLFYEELFSQESMDRLETFLDAEIPRPEFDRYVYKGSQNGAPNSALIAQAREALAPVYAYRENRFGADLPNSWTA